MKIPSDNNEFDRFLKVNRPDIPAVPPDELDQLRRRVATRPARLSWSLGAGLATAALVLVFLWQPAVPANRDVEVDLEAFLAQAGKEMFEPEIALEESWDVYANL